MTASGKEVRQATAVTSSSARARRCGALWRRRSRLKLCGRHARVGFFALNTSTFSGGRGRDPLVASDNEGLLHRVKNAPGFVLMFLFLNIDKRVIAGRKGRPGKSTPPS
jgi:hypothetical protein